METEVQLSKGYEVYGQENKIIGYKLSSCVALSL